MNVYLVQEEGDPRLYVAADFNGAILAAWYDVLRDTVEELGRHPNDVEAQAERTKWENESLQSVTLVGPVENFDAAARALRPQPIE